MNTSIGFHTFTISKRIIGKEIAIKLVKDIRKYMESSGRIRLIPPANKYDGLLVYYVNKEDRGITWILRYNTHSRMYKEYIIEARINPKTLAGINDYITASNISYLSNTEERFNDEARKISKILGKFAHYTPKRIDFCINFDLRELGINCTAEQMMKLIKMGDYPSYFEEWMKYDPISKRKKSGKYSFYLKSGSVNINCYYKYKQLEEKYPDSPDNEDALHVIRFEVQCKYRKLCNMMENLKREVPSYLQDHYYVLNRLMSDLTCNKMIKLYFDKIIKPGDYYTLKEATNIIEDHGFRPGKEQMLIDTLKEINRVGIARTRASLTPDAQQTFYRSLKTFSELKINPVTIPKSFGIKQIPNLLDAFNKLRDSGQLSSCSLIDPYEPLEMPFDDDVNYSSFHNVYDDNSDTGESSELEYEETFVFDDNIREFNLY